MIRIIEARSLRTIHHPSIHREHVLKIKLLAASWDWRYFHSVIYLQPCWCSSRCYPELSLINGCEESTKRRFPFIKLGSQSSLLPLNSTTSSSCSSICLLVLLSYIPGSIYLFTVTGWWLRWGNRSLSSSIIIITISSYSSHILSWRVFKFYCR